VLATEIVPGLLRWCAPHPDWTPQDDWDRLVCSVLYELEDVVALIDPLLPSEGREEFLEWLDGRVGVRAVSILTTIRWHARDRDELAERYRSRGERAWNALPAGVVQKPLRGAGETVYWLPRAEALVAGDALIGDGAGGLALCPEEWLDDVTVDRRGLARLLEGLLELPVERVLVSHGEPVLHDGRAALARAIAAARA
jgi:hypothetical protein